MQACTCAGSRGPLGAVCAWITPPDATIAMTATSQCLHGFAIIAAPTAPTRRKMPPQSGRILPYFRSGGHRIVWYRAKFRQKSCNNGIEVWQRMGRRHALASLVVRFEAHSDGRTDRPNRGPAPKSDASEYRGCGTQTSPGPNVLTPLRAIAA